jgi:hypothetical protein
MADPLKPIMSFRVNADVKKALQKFAAIDRRSLSSYIELALEKHIEERERSSGGKPAGKRK